MFKRRTYDWLTGGFFVLVILAGFLGYLFFDNIFPIGSEGIFRTFLYNQILTYSLILIYYIFILVLTIQLHSRGDLSTLDMISVIVIPPSAPFYYLFSLREKLDNFDGSNNLLNNKNLFKKRIRPSSMGLLRVVWI